MAYPDFEEFIAALNAHEVKLTRVGFAGATFLPAYHF